MPDKSLPDPDSAGEHTPTSDAHLQNLFERLCDQLATTSELEELGAHLTADKDIRERYLKYLSLHSSLQDFAWPATEICLNGSCAPDGDEIPRRSVGWRR